MELPDEQYIASVKEVIQRVYPSKLSYFEGHLPRFLVGKRMLLKHLSLDTGSKVLEAGSWLPFYGMVPYLAWGCKVVCTSLTDLNWRLSDRLYFYRSNLNTDDYGTEEWDLIILTEVLEHLPSNLYEVMNRIIKSIKKYGYLLISFPLGGVIPYPYDMVLPYPSDVEHDSHLREFTEETALSFLASFGQLRVLERESVYTREYGGNILVCLAQKVLSNTKA